MLLNIANQLGQDIKKAGAQNENIALRSAVSFSERAVSAQLKSAVIPPVLQLNKIPVGIDVSDYTDAFGPANPTGDYIKLYRFSSLTNDISKFTQFYYPSGNELDSIYSNIVNSAAADPNAAFTKIAISNALNLLNSGSMASLSGNPNNWYPVYADPFDWYDQITTKTNLATSEIDFSQPGSAFDNQFTIINGSKDNNLNWGQMDSSGNLQQTQLQSGSNLSNIKFKFLQVQLRRPWFDFSLFLTGGWYLSGQDIGFVSSGQIDANDGIFPLYTTSFIIATDLVIESSLTANDSQFVRNNLNEKGTINLGPFQIASLVNDSSENSTLLQNSGYFILAWISQLVNLAPRTTN